MQYTKTQTVLYTCKSNTQFLFLMLQLIISSAIIKFWCQVLYLTRNAWQSPTCSPPGACKTQRLLDQSAPKFNRRRGVIDSVNAHILVANYLSAVECQCKNECWVCWFSPNSAKIGHHSNVS